MVFCLLEAIEALLVDPVMVSCLAEDTRLTNCESEERRQNIRGADRKIVPLPGQAYNSEMSMEKSHLLKAILCC